MRQALQAIVIDPLWESWRTSTSDRGQKIKSIILDDAWLDKVQYLLRFTEPILTLIRAFDTDTPCLGEVYENIDSMLERIMEIIRGSENDPYETFYYLVKDIVTERWNKMTTSLHLWHMHCTINTIILKICLSLVEQHQTRILKWYKDIRQL